MESAERLMEFKAFLKSHIDVKKASIEVADREKDEFLSEYPLTRIKELSVDEYCLGTEQSKDSFCYSLEFGKYRYTGFGIGGGSARKFGVYFSKAEQCYKHGTDPINDIKEL